MMPYSALDPPSHSLAASQLLHPQSLQLGNYIGEEDDSSSAVKIYNHATPLIGPWRWRITALMAIFTLMLLPMMSALADAGLPTGVERSVLDPADKPAEESELTACPTAPNNAKERHELVSRRSNDSVDQSQFRNRGLMRMHKFQSELNFNDPQEVATPRSHRHRQRVRIPGRLTSSDRRILVSSACSNKDISIFQSPDGSSGIPRYAVQIMNNCMSDCPPSDIHVFCGWFASALLVNPNSFKRIAFNDCLVNGGKPLRHGETLRFTYANSFMYPIRFKSASFCK